MKRLISAIALAGLASAASAQLVVTGSTAKTFSGYDGEPASVTGVLNSGVQGTLTSLSSGTATFTYLGNESGNVNQFNFAIGNQSLTEGSLLGSSISGLIGPGALKFSFTDLSTASTFSNGTLAIAYISNLATKYGSFQYVLGFNDNGSSDGDFDDFVVGVNITPAIPEPQTYALLLAGLGAVVFVAVRRRRP
jgi:hypothetical protein